MAEMETTAVVSLLARVESLSAPQRDAEVARFALALPAEKVSPFIAQLSAGSPYEQRLAGVAARACSNTERIADAVCNPDPYVHIPALRVARSRPQLVKDDIFRAALEDASAAHRRALLKSMAGRPALADSLIDSVKEEWGDAVAGDLLAACSPDVVRKQFPSLMHAVRQWRPLVRHHPDLVRNYLVGDLSSTTIAYPVWWIHYGGALALLIDRAPKSLNMGTVVLDMLEKYPAYLPLPLISRLATLARADSNRLLKLCTAPKEYGLRSVTRKKLLRIVARSGAPEFKAYVRQLDRWDVSSTLLAVAPSDRPMLCDIVLEKYPTLSSSGVLTHILDAAPRDYSVKLARRAVAAYTKRKESELSILEMKSYLPPEEVAEELLLATRKPDASMRAAAWSCFMNNAARSRDPAHIVRAVEQMAERLKNEQSPVSSTAWYAVPARHLPVEALAPLRTCVQNALDARDVSDGELSTISMLAFNILCAHSSSDPHRTFAIELFGKLERLDRAGRILHIGTLAKGLEKEIYAVLAPLMDADAARNDYALLLSFIDNLEVRAETIPELQSRLAAALAYEPITDDYLKRVIELYLQPKRPRSERAAEVLALHPSAIGLSSVADIVSSVRTDLLALDQTPYGRFIPTDTVWSFKPRCSHDVRRWNPAQQAAYLSQLQAVAEDDTLPTRDRVRAIRGLGAVNGGLELARKWAGNEDVALAEAGLGALSRSPDDLPFLLSFAGSDRARVALYAADSVSLLVEPSVLRDTLSVLLARKDAKVTSRKVAVRLIASRLPARQAAETLGAIVADDTTHRDVRAACVAAASGLLSSPAGWAILDAAMKSDDTARGALLHVSSLDLSPGHRERYAALICTLASDADHGVAANAIRSLNDWAPYAENAGEVLRAQVVDMALPERVWAAAVVVLVAISDKDAGVQVFEALLALLTLHTADMSNDADTSVDDDNDNVDTDSNGAEDLPAYRRIQRIMMQFNSQDVKKYALASGPAVGVLYGYGERRLACLTMVHFTTWEDGTAELLQSLVAMCHLAPATAYQVSQALLRSVRNQRPLNDGVLPAAARLAQAAQEGEVEGERYVCGLLAVALVDGAGSHGWTAEGRRVLRMLRKCTTGDISALACEVVVR